MELALYCPDCGYYEKEKDNVGKRGDFMTSVSVGSLFGELLAYQLAEWLEAGREPGGRVRIVEAGAHDGRLAADILNWLRAYRQKLFDGLEYFTIEPSAKRKEWQQETLKDFGKTVGWLPEINSLKTLPTSSFTIIFSNELLDAMPIDRFGWDAKNKKWFEWRVALEGEKFVWSRLPNTDNRASRFTFCVSEMEPLFDVLPDGYTIEISPAAENWWRSTAEVLTRGKLIAIDYGFTSEEQFVPERTNGTLRAYHHHRVTNDILANPGDQDLTAHVNFSAIQQAGEKAGLRTETFCSQPQFLTRIVEKIFKQPASFGEWGSKQTRQLQTLTHPEHMGRGFRVLVQSR